MTTEQEKQRKKIDVNRNVWHLPSTNPVHSETTFLYTFFSALFGCQ